MMYAIENGHKEVARYLISQGADLSAKNSWSFSPLHYAIFSNQTDIASLLIEKAKSESQAIAADPVTEVAIEILSLLPGPENCPL